LVKTLVALGSWWLNKLYHAFNCLNKVQLPAMRNLSTGLTIILSLSFYFTTDAQDAKANKLSVTDSITSREYWSKANKSGLYSQTRQRYLDSALTIDHTSAYYWQQKAMPLYKQKKYEAGAPFLDSAVKYNPKQYMEYRGFMKCIFQKSYTSAIADFHTAKAWVGESGVMDHSYDFYIGLSYLQLDKFDSAEYYLVKSTSEQRKSKGEDWVHPVDLFYLGIVYYEVADYNKAIEHFNKSLKQYHNFSDVKYYKANCLKRLNRMDEAYALMKEAQADFKAGATINEDNMIYELYPYQIFNGSYYNWALKSMEAVK
jgi:tetratricopeptide (TPR) repeat protein